MKPFSYYAENTRLPFNLKLILAAFLSAVMFAFITLTGDTIMIEQSLILAFGAYFSLFYFAGLVIFFLGKNTDKIETVLFFGAGLAAVTYIRFCMVYYVSNDYNAFLANWIEQMQGYSGISALAADIGDYTVPYQCFLLILSKIGGNDLFFIKMFSMSFDLVGAYFVMKTVELKTSNVTVRALAFLLTLAVPTVCFNSAMWGQCDMMFTAFCLGGLYFALKGRPRLAVIMASVAFAFKIQTVFFAPVFLVLFLIKKIRWRDLLWFPAVMIISVLPAVIAGKGIFSALGVYAKQTGEYGMMYLNAPSIWRFLDGANNPYPQSSDLAPFDNFNKIAILLTALAVAALVYIAYRYRAKLDTRRMVSIAFIGALMIPFLLPRMHERYFFAADIMALVYFFYNKKRWYVPIIVIYNSYVVYVYYLFRVEIGTDIVNSGLLLLVLAQALYEFVNELINAPVPENSLCVFGENGENGDFADGNLSGDNDFADGNLSGDNDFSDQDDLVLSSIPDND